MPDTENFTQEGARLSDLKKALLDERRRLELDTHAVRARTDALLGEGLTVQEPIVVIPRDQP